LDCQNGFQKGRSGINPLFSTKLLIGKRRQFTLETHLAFDKFKRDNLFEILQSKNIPNLSLKSITEIYSGKK
jgi:hypothetical protein